MEGKGRIFLRHLAAHRPVRDAISSDRKIAVKLLQKVIFYSFQRHDLLTALGRFLGIFMGFYGLVSPLFRGGGTYKRSLYIVTYVPCAPG